jgi:TetR/AcrR family acrAB operon transcriptional repressor
MYNMRRTKEEAEQTRKTLLEASLQIFSEKGYQASRLEDVAQTAGLTRGAIYHHFGSKAGLYKALLDDAAAPGSQAMNRAIAEGGTFKEICTRIMVYQLSIIEENRRTQDMMEVVLFKIGPEEELAQVNRKRVEENESLIQGIATFMAQGIAQGEIRPELNPFTIARAFVAYQHGLATLWLSNRKAFSLRDQARELADVFMKGIVSK